MRLAGVVVSLAVACVITLAGAGAAATDQSYGATGGVAVLDSRSGEELWRVRPSKKVSYFYAAPGHDIVVATSGTCGDEDLHATGLVAFDAASGEKRWSLHGPKFVLPTTSGPTATYFQAAAPVDARGVVVVGSGPGVNGYAARDGELLWKTRDDMYAIGASKSAVFVAVRNDITPGSFLALDRRTGEVRWQNDGWTATFDIVAADARHVVVATGDLNRQPYGPVELVVLDARSGVEQARFDAGSPELFYFSEVGLTRQLLVYAESSSVVGRDLTDGTEKWRRTMGDDTAPASMARSNGNETVFTLDYSLNRQERLVALDAANGEDRWTKGNSRLVAADNRTTVVKAPHPTRMLQALGTRSGAPVWSYRVPEGLASGGAATEWRVRIADERVSISTVCDFG